MFHQPRSILDLPPEIMVKIVNKLPYTDVQSIRLTCWAFNDAGKYVQKMALHKMKRLADSALKKCHTGHQTTNFNETRVRRAWLGLSSVQSLAGIIRVADACTYYFVLDGLLPPVPCALLTELEKALSIATKRNPLVGRDRLKRIFASFKEYLTMAMNSLQSPLKMTSVFRSIMDLMVCLPLKTYSIAQTPHGLHCHIDLNTVRILLSRDRSFLSAPLLIRFLAKLNVALIEECCDIWMENLFAEEIQTEVDADIDKIELTIHCRPEQIVGVRSLKHIRRLEPIDFVIVLGGVTVVWPTMEEFEENDELEEVRTVAFFTFSSQDPFPPDTNSVPLNNTVSSAL